MERRITVAEYLGMPETNKPQELAYGILREPPAPRYGHQALVTRMTAALSQFAARTRLGVVCVSPVDVVLDQERALVIQPDIVFVATARQDIIRDQIWGAPDLVVEVLSPSTARQDRSRKLGWYRHYGVKECWLVDEGAAEVAVIRLDAAADTPGRVYYRARQRLYSRVLRGFRPSVHRLLTTG